VLALFASSLQFVMGTGGMASFGHAAYFGLGAYAAALSVKHGMPMEGALALAPLVAAAGAFIVGAFCARVSGVYLAMLTLAFAQIVWSVAFQWDDFTGGSNGVVGVWPPGWLDDKQAYFWFTLALVGAALASIAWIADYTAKGRKWVEYLTWVQSDRTRASIAVQVDAADFDRFRERFQPILDSFRMP